MRSLSFPQDSSDVTKLKTIANVFIKGSPENNYVIKNINWLNDNQITADGTTYFSALDTNLIAALPQLLVNNPKIKYDILKGKGNAGRSRSVAECSGIIQAAFDGQKKATFKNIKTSKEITKTKPYVSDWVADGFLRWAISIGILDYEETTDTCSLTSIGEKIAKADKKTFNVLIGEAFLSYPPACRVLSLLDSQFGVEPGSKADKKWTKFKLGAEIGFIGEAGFTNIPENIWIAEYCTAPIGEKKNVKNNREGTMDKHARMICSWLKQIGWVESRVQNVDGTFGGTAYNTDLNCYYITIVGHNAYKKSLGNSSHAKTNKILYTGSLATKMSNSEYLCIRRANVINTILGTKKAKDTVTINKEIAKNGFKENDSTINDDIEGLRRLGINIECTNGKYKIKDNIVCLNVKRLPNTLTKDIQTAIKDNLRQTLQNVDHKYLCLIDYAIDGSKNRDFEQTTIELLTKELGFDGKWLGGASKPDGIISYCKNGMIVDTKAYSGGYTLPRNQKDEMYRYIDEYLKKDPKVNPNKWWENFNIIVNHINFAFVSSSFSQNVPNGLQDISNRISNPQINGGAITAETLLSKAELIKSKSITHKDFFDLFESNSIVS